MEQLLQANANWKFFFNSIGTALPGRPIQVRNLLGAGHVQLLISGVERQIR